MNFSQTTNITDRTWKIVLYKLFEENRKYVKLEQISNNMINAIIAVEDKNFWTNPWIDIYWILRAWLYDITNPWWTIHGWSTITQQLIKNLLLNKDKRIERKLKEIVLSLKIKWYLKKEINSKYKWLSIEEQDRKIKEKILELYLNYIFLWNNAYWVESASNIYFWTSANNLWILESAILSWMPQAPSKYNPYTQKNIVMWNIEINDNWDVFSLYSKDINKELQSLIYDKIVLQINESNFSIQREAWSVLKYIQWLLSFNVMIWENNYEINYSLWRKDSTLARMYEEWYINKDEIKKALIDWLNYEFSSAKVDIKAPHFVFWIIDEMKKEYWEELLFKWWLTIKTTLDYDMQIIAEESIFSQTGAINNAWANNASMIYIDSKNWDVLSYVWSLDYYDKEIDWQVDLVQSPRQIWSVMKPFVYTLWFMQNNFTIDTPIYDTKFKVWKDEPSNVDWEFMWLMPIKKALAYSRNIPAIKMFFIIWQDKPFIDFLNSIWITSLKENINNNPNYHYWYPLSIGAWEIKMLELANWYMHLSAMWEPANINPILEVRSSDNSIIYQKTEKKQNKIIPYWVAYMLWNILSDKSNFPTEWLNMYSFDWLKIATKSWTTNVVNQKTKEKLPRDGWFVTYTPSKVWVFWVWNTRWEPMNKKAYWWTVNKNVWKWFFKKLKDNNLIFDEDVNEKEVKKVSISKLSWKLSSYQNTPIAMTQNTLWYIYNLPKEIDNTFKKIELDILCNWLVSDITPKKDIQTAYIIDPTTIMPQNRDYDNIIDRWKQRWIVEYQEKQNLNFLLSWDAPISKCEERQILLENWIISLELPYIEENQDISNNFSLRYEIDSPSFDLKNFKVYWDNRLVKNYNYLNSNNNKWAINAINITIPEYLSKNWEHTLKAIAEDIKWYQAIKKIKVNMISQDIWNPYLLEDKLIKKINTNWEYDLYVFFDDKESFVKWWKIYQNWKLIDEFDWNYSILFVSNLDWLEYEVIDNNWNIWKWDINF